MNPGDLEPLPPRTLEALPFWDGCREGRLMIQRCPSCAEHQFYPRDFCMACGASAIEFVEVSGRAVVHSFTVCHRPLAPRFGTDPYVIALVDLEEGPRMMTTIVGADPDDVHIDMPVTVTFQQLTDDITLPVFTPVGAV